MMELKVDVSQMDAPLSLAADTTAEMFAQAAKLEGGFIAGGLVFRPDACQRPG